MSIFLTSEQVEMRRIKNELVAQETIEKNDELIRRYNGLCKSIITGLDSVISKFDELRTVEDEIHGLGKEPGQIVTAALGYQIIGNSATSKNHAVDSRRTIGERIK